MRAIDCPCGHRLGGADDGELFRLAREHVDRDHPEMRRTDQQLWERIRAEIPDLDEQIERAEFADLREWLRENVHKHGRKFMSKELLQRVVGGSIDSGQWRTLSAAARSARSR